MFINKSMYGANNDSSEFFWGTFPRVVRATFVRNGEKIVTGQILQFIYAFVHYFFVFVFLSKYAWNVGDDEVQILQHDKNHEILSSIV